MYRDLRKVELKPGEPAAVAFDPPPFRTRCLARPALGDGR